MPIPIIHLARHVGQFMHMIIGTLYGGVYLPVLLMVRGIVTQGQVTGHVTRRQRKGYRRFSQIIPSAPGSRSATIPIILIMSDEAIAHSVLVPCCHCCSPLG